MANSSRSVGTLPEVHNCMLPYGTRSKIPTGNNYTSACSYYNFGKT